MSQQMKIHVVHLKKNCIAITALGVLLYNILKPQKMKRIAFKIDRYRYKTLYFTTLSMLLFFFYFIRT